MGQVDLLGFRGAALAQINREQHDESGGEELTLPVLEALGPEPRATCILRNGHAGSPVFTLFLVVGALPSAACMARDPKNSATKARLHEFS